MFYELLVPIDADDPEVAAQVLALARGLAKSHQVSLTVLDVAAGAAEDAAPGGTDPGAEARQRLERLLAETGALGDIKGVLQVEGSIFRAIRSAARAIGVDLVLLGSRDPEFTRRLVGIDTGDTVKLGDITLDRRERRIQRAGREIHLGPTEYLLLDCLLRQPGRAFSREELRELVWGPGSDTEARTVDVHVARLRKSLNEGAADDPIRTVRTVGYAWDRDFGG